MCKYFTLDDFNPAGSRILIRTDLNVPVKDGKIEDKTRIERAVPTIKNLVTRGGRVIIISHFGRPEGREDPKLSLKPLVRTLSEALGGRPIHFVNNCIGEQAIAAAQNLADGDIILLENLRFHKGEENNDLSFAQALATLGDYYVNDAFAASHRSHASIDAITTILPSFAGLLMQSELEALKVALENPNRPILAIVGGSKISTKINLLNNLVTKVNKLIVGGAMANTFLLAHGFKVGKSIVERELTTVVDEIEANARTANCEILLQEDVIVAKELVVGTDTKVVRADEVPNDSMILDAGPKSVLRFIENISQCKTLLWNGPLGAFETPPFDEATILLAKNIAHLTKEGKLLSVAGGGDTVSALNKAGTQDQFTYVSTAGGAFLEWLEGKDLPGIKGLKRVR